MNCAPDGAQTDDGQMSGYPAILILLDDIRFASHRVHFATCIASTAMSSAIMMITAAYAMISWVIAASLS
jgi:hypothetical protein